MRLIITALAATVLSACGGESGDRAASSAVNQPQIAVRSAEQDQLHQLDEMNRNIGLKRAIQDSGLRCRRVLQSGYVQEHNKLSMWTASCDDKRSWGIFVGPDGSAQVRPCAEMAKLGLPECRIAADPTGRASRAAAKATPASP
ncbi:MAG TPA: hypothetical protein VM913_08485 [Sphingomicrobium sp.]|jgi:hypothetical protein|nr:hypothetical protein [Sphingomicrobium sp.]